MYHIIGIDIGTTHVKAVVASVAGNVLQEIKEGYPTLNPLPGYQEQNADDIFRAVLKVLKQAAGTITDKKSISCISFSAAMHSLMAVNKEGKPLIPLMIWADTRSNKYALELRNTRQGDLIYQRTGTPVHPMSPLCKVAWIRDEVPVVFAAAHKFISAKEYIFYQFFNEFVVDHSIASATGLFDIHQLNWCDESLQFAGISVEQLSRPVSTTQVFTKLKEEYRLQLGLGENTSFLIGAGDGCLANIGAGAVLPGELALTIGTSGAVRKIGDHPVNDPKQRLFNYRLDEKTYLSGGAVNNGGVILKWVMDVFLDKDIPEQEKMKEIMETAATAPAGSGGLIFLPYLYGERAPVWDAAAKGVFVGISPIHSKAHFIRAVLEGISFSLLQIVKAIEETGEPVHIIYANGGFIQSPLWLRIMTDIMNKKIRVSHAGDASAMGAIFMAMQFLGHLKEWNEVKNLVDTDEEFIPDQPTHQCYLENYVIYEHLYEKLKDDFKRIDAIQTKS
ncbi:MAG: gluconokinase [Chitinophagaceae bacterium]